VIIPRIFNGAGDPVSIATMRHLDDEDLTGLVTALRQLLADAETIRNQRRNEQLTHQYPERICKPVASRTRLRLITSPETGKGTTS